MGVAAYNRGTKLLRRRIDADQKITRFDAAALKVKIAIENGAILIAHNAVAHEDVSVGTYVEAVNRGNRFAVLSKSQDSILHLSWQAALKFVSLVGTTRAVQSISKLSS